jgi:hypothetical protein
VLICGVQLPALLGGRRRELATSRVVFPDCHRLIAAPTAIEHESRLRFRLSASVSVAARETLAADDRRSCSTTTPALSQLTKASVRQSSVDSLGGSSDAIAARAASPLLPLLRDCCAGGASGGARCASNANCAAGRASSRTASTCAHLRETRARSAPTRAMAPPAATPSSMPFTRQPVQLVDRVRRPSSPGRPAESLAPRAGSARSSPGLRVP